MYVGTNYQLCLCNYIITEVLNKWVLITIFIHIWNYLTYFKLVSHLKTLSSWNSHDCNVPSISIISVFRLLFCNCWTIIAINHSGIFQGHVYRVCITFSYPLWQDIYNVYLIIIINSEPLKMSEHVTYLRFAMQQWSNSCCGYMEVKPLLQAFFDCMCSLFKMFALC